MKTFKILSLLLEYPTDDLQKNMDDLKVGLKEEGLLTANHYKPLFKFMDDLARRNLMRLQEEYVALFDRSRAHSLYLFEHVHGESRDRGQAMIDLSDHYLRHGFKLSASELPDYLPLFLEFLSQQEIDEAQNLLGDIIHITAAIEAKLKAKKSGYMQVFRALEAVSVVKVDKKLIKKMLEEAPEEDLSFEALDKEWEETPAFGAEGNAACTACPSSVSAAQMLTGASAPGQIDRRQ